MKDEAEKPTGGFDPNAPGYWTPGAAWYLGRAQVTLRKWRCTGAGPRYRLIHARAYYTRAALDEFVASHASYRSTSEATVATTTAA